MNLYNAITILIVLTMLGMIIQLESSTIVSKREKKLFQISFLLISISAASECLAVIMNQNPEGNRWIHAVFKFIEFSLAPTIPFVWIFIIKKKFNFKHIMEILLLGNVVCESISIFTPFIFTIDANNLYHRCSYYWIYILCYALAILVFFYEAFDTIKYYQNKSLFPLIWIFVFLVTGILFSVIKSEIRTSWLTGCISSILLYSYFENVFLQVDVLTGLLNRRALEGDRKRFNYPCDIIVFDIDNFKEINDTIGHMQADIILRKSAKSMYDVYGQTFSLYRIGGDEFCAISKRGRKYSLEHLQCTLEKLENERNIPSVSVGSSYYDGKGDFMESLNQADMLMYENKKNKKKSPV